MIITYHGHEFIKVQFGDLSLGFNPISKNSKKKVTRFGADVALVSLDDPDTNGVECLSRVEKSPFVIKGPGEYEIKGVFIKGFASRSMYGGVSRSATMYLISIENMNLCFLGSLSSKVLESQVSEALSEVDILFVPIGGDGVLDAAASYALAVELEPKLIIPIHCIGAGGKNMLSAFLAEADASGTKAEERLTLKKKDLEGKEGEVMVLAES